MEFNMKNKWLFKISVFIISIFMIVSCKTGSEKKAMSTEIKSKTEADLLMETLAKNGDYVNSRQFPSMIKAPTLYASLDSGTLVIDLRDPETFANGHIKGAVNVQFPDIPSYFENKIKPFEYEKIVMVCYRGQMSSYTTCLLRLMGYGNVYSMRWGMTTWNPDLAGNVPWDSIISSKYTSQLETKENQPPAPGVYPDLATGKSSGDEILKDRIKKIFTDGISDVFVSAENVFAKRDSFFVINYERKDKYDSGHIPGAIRYKPGGTLGIPEEMLTIPSQKDVVVYCGTGHNSAFVVAYLRLLGYKAHSLRLGNNSFMHDKMLNEKVALSWEAFTPEMLNKFPYVK
jgi:rhodanese-related sulfurtransferase